MGRRNCRVSGSGHSPCPVRAAGRAGASVPARAQRRGARPVVRGQARHLPGEVLDLLPIDFDPLLQGFDLLGLPLLLLRVLRGQHAAAAGANWRRSTGGVRGARQRKLDGEVFPGSRMAPRSEVSIRRCEVL